MPSFSHKKNLYAVILAAGAGMRLWPLSRELYPKHFLKLFGPQTLIERTFLRLKKLTDPKRIYVVVSNDLKDETYLELKDRGFLKENLLIQPAIKDTAPIIAFAIKTIFDKDNSAVVAVLPADHLIKPDSNFVRTMRKSLPLANKGYLVTLGIIPNSPRTDFGYIKPDYGTDKEQGAGWLVKKFVEKPPIELAGRFIKKGYFWNSGIFVWKAKSILEEIEKKLPKIYKILRWAGKDDAKFFKAYSQLPSISIDRGVMEHAKNAWVIPGKFDWQDIGSWQAVYELLPKDSGKNILNRSVIQKGCQKSLIYGAPKRLVVAIGLNDMIVVDTEDAVLIAYKNKLPELKTIIEEIKNRNLPHYQQHPTVYRPWGYYTVLEEGRGFKVKKVCVLPERKLSLQMHKMRSEHWVVLSGTAKVFLNNRIIILSPHQSIGVSAGARHRLENPSKKEPLDIVEIQNGPYLGEDDIIRIDDDYERLK